MPHMPRRRSPTTGISPEFTQPPQDHAPIPVATKAREATQPDSPEARRKKIGLGTINLHTYEPDFKQLYSVMFGKEPDVDPHTGQLVPAQSTGVPASAVGHGGKVVPGHAVGPVFNRLADPHAHRPPPGYAG